MKLVGVVAVCWRLFGVKMLAGGVKGRRKRWQQDRGRQEGSTMVRGGKPIPRGRVKVNIGREEKMRGEEREEVRFKMISGFKISNL